MIHPDHEVLLQGRIDGTLTGDEREQLDRLLATDADVRARADELDRLADLVDSLGDVDPPSGLTQQILSAIAARGVRAPAHDIARIATFDTKASHAAHSGARMDGGTVMGKKVMWGLAAAAVIALAVLNYTGIVPPREGTEGTIGAAKRYQAPQIADKDVALGDTSAQAFIQSDLFDQMMHDGNVRQLLSNEATRAALKSAEFAGRSGHARSCPGAREPGAPPGSRQRRAPGGDQRTRLCRRPRAARAERGAERARPCRGAGQSQFPRRCRGSGLCPGAFVAATRRRA